MCFVLFIVVVCVCVCAPEQLLANARFYMRDKRERTNEKRKKTSACKSRARSADVGALLRRARRQDKAGGVARRLTPLPPIKNETQR